MWLAKPSIFTIWPFRRKRLLALVLNAEDTAMNETEQTKNILLWGSLNSIYTFILHRIGMHLHRLHSAYIQYVLNEYL